MANEQTPLEQLQAFLNKLFQFESEDLDFGIYKILHYKRREIKQFIDELLVDRVKEQLQTLTETEVKEAREALEDLKAEPGIQKWLEAHEKGDEKRLEIYEEDNKEDIRKYRKLEKQIKEAEVSEDTESYIYNHLTLFFSRYYDKGDFISKRRFGKNEKYVVPYNGEETHFYWANHDQYYIKSSEHFQQFAFKVPHHNGDLTVNFKLTEADVEQGNVKAEEDKYFVLSEKEPEWEGDEELTIYFEFRPLTEEEKNETGNQRKQDKLNEKAAVNLQEKLQHQPIAHELWKTNEKGQTYLLQRLNHYTRKNQYDFFIHKDLKGFLQRELDFYIKSELVHVDDLYVLESETHFDRIRQNFKAVKVFKQIADTIIDFLAQIEDFQKKLWEKQKFVLNTEWVITIDRLVEYVGEEEAKPLLEEVINNQKQVNEWKELFGEWHSPIEFKNLKKDLYQWNKLPIDTKNFSDSFKSKLLSVISQFKSLSNEVNGLVINSNNLDALSLLTEKFSKKIDSIHIDPPYNSDTSGFLYKNSYRESSWLSMMNDRIHIGKRLLNDAGSFLCHVDENEYEKLHNLFSNYSFPYMDTVVWDKKNPMMGGSGLAIQHEYILWGSNFLGQFEARSENVKQIIRKAEEIIKNHNGVNEVAKKEFAEWVKSQKNLSGGEKMYHLLDDEGRVYRLVAMTWPNPNPAPEQFFEPLIHPVTKKPCPVPSRGWSRTPEKMKELLDKDEIVFGKDETTQPQRKIFLDIDRSKPISSVIRNGRRGKYEIEALGLSFSYSHPVSLYDEVNYSTTPKNGINLDFFAGSGTNFHSIQNLNKEDKGQRKSLLIELGGYVYTLILPRIKKIAYTFDWKDGYPKDNSMNGLGVFFKYQRLEQYEEALENISFNASEDTQQKALQFRDYMPKYFLEFETQNSQTLVNTDAMKDPWDYRLRVWDGYTYDTEQAVDLVETFNYLIGLHLEQFITKDLNSQKYQFIKGHDNNDTRILVVWRKVKNWKKEDFEVDGNTLKDELAKWEYDQLYINDQAHLPEGFSYTPVEEVFKQKMVP